MFSNEIKELVKISGGKIVISEGDLENSYVVMNLKDYLKEKEIIKNKKNEEKAEFKNFLETENAVGNQIKNALNKIKIRKGNKHLTKDNHLDKIDAEIDDFYRNEREKELSEILKAEQEEFKYDFNC